MAIEKWVEQASGLLFRASRPKLRASVDIFTNAIVPSDFPVAQIRRDAEFNRRDACSTLT
jgi:hypothetical protein